MNKPRNTKNQDKTKNLRKTNENLRRAHMSTQEKHQKT